MKKVKLVILGLLLSMTTGCATTPEVAQNLSAMIAVRLATVAAVQGDALRAQKVVKECEILIAQIDSGEGLTADALQGLLNTQIIKASLKPAEKAVLLELVAVARAATQSPEILPEDSRERLRTVLSWVLAAASAQALQNSTPSMVP